MTPTAPCFSMWVSLLMATAALCALCALSLAEKRPAFSVTPLIYGDSNLPPPPRGNPPDRVSGGRALLPPPKGSPRGGAAQSWHDAFSMSTRPARKSKEQHSQEQHSQKRNLQRSLHLAESHYPAKHQSRTRLKVVSHSIESPETLVSTRQTRNQPDNVTTLIANSKMPSKDTPVALAVPLRHNLSSNVPEEVTKTHPTHRLIHLINDARANRNTTTEKASMRIAPAKPADWIKKLAAVVKDAKIRKADQARARQQARAELEDRQRERWNVQGKILRSEQQHTVNEEAQDLENWKRARKLARQHAQAKLARSVASANKAASAAEKAELDTKVQARAAADRLKAKLEKQSRLLVHALALARAADALRNPSVTTARDPGQPRDDAQLEARAAAAGPAEKSGGTQGEESQDALVDAAASLALVHHSSGLPTLVQNAHAVLHTTRKKRLGAAHGDSADPGGGGGGRGGDAGFSQTQGIGRRLEALLTAVKGLRQAVLAQEQQPPLRKSLGHEKRPASGGRPSLWHQMLALRKQRGMVQQPLVKNLELEVGGLQEGLVDVDAVRRGWQRSKRATLGASLKPPTSREEQHVASLSGREAAVLHEQEAALGSGYMLPAPEETAQAPPPAFKVPWNVLIY